MPEDSTYPAGVADLEENKINPSRARCHVVARHPEKMWPVKPGEPAEWLFGPDMKT